MTPRAMRARLSQSVRGQKLMIREAIDIVGNIAALGMLLLFIALIAS